MKAKLTHVLVVALIIMGVVYLWHMSSAHGGLNVGAFNANLGTK